MRRATRIAIIGGGIGGLTAARALQLRGFEPKVYEAAPELREIGAGVLINPNGMKALRSLQLEDAVRAVGWQSEARVVRDWRSGRVIASSSQTYWANRFGAAECLVHRADLLDVLAAALPLGMVQLGARCLGAQTTENVASATFADGAEIEADAIIGADGIHSAVRASLFGPDAPRFTGKIAWRLLVPIGAVKGGVDPETTTWIGPDGAIVVYLVRRGELVNVAAHHESDAWTEESWTRECDRSEALDAYRGWHESLLRLFSASERHYKWALYDREPISQWTKGRITLLGDAAHPMLPYLGQGAGQAMEDGCVLAAALAAVPDDVGTALQMYERSRVPRANRVVLAARAMGEENHETSWLGRFKRDALIALRNRVGSDRTGYDRAWLFDYDAGSPTALAALPERE